DYNVTGAARLLGPLDGALAEKCLKEIVRRHEVLRTHFEVVDEEPAQVIGSWQSFAMARLDHCSESALRAEMERPFDLAKGPLFRATLFGKSGEEYVLLLGMHHAVSDLWSKKILFDEFEALYAAYSAHLPSPLPAL